MDKGSKTKIERYVMFRIGFDPMLEAEQRNQELIRAVKQYQLANQGTGISIKAGSEVVYGYSP